MVEWICLSCLLDVGAIFYGKSSLELSLAPLCSRYAQLGRGTREAVEPMWSRTIVSIGGIHVEPSVTLLCSLYTQPGPAIFFIFNLYNLPSPIIHIAIRFLVFPYIYILISVEMYTLIYNLFLIKNILIYWCLPLACSTCGHDNTSSQTSLSDIYQASWTKSIPSVRIAFESVKVKCSLTLLFRKGSNPQSSKILSTADDGWSGGEGAAKASRRRWPKTGRRSWFGQTEYLALGTAEFRVG